MLETDRWSDETREVSINSILSHQTNATLDAWYVPYKTGMALNNQNDLLMVSHFGRDPKVEDLDIMRLKAQGKSELMTSGIYDCAALSVEIGSLSKVLIHAYGASSMIQLLNVLERELPLAHNTHSRKLETKLKFAYNPTYVTHIFSYEWLYLFLVKKLRPTMMQRIWVSQKTEIVI